MFLNELHAKLDDVWDDFWPATELRPLAVVDFINCIFFLRQLDETPSSVFAPDQEDLRWSSFQHLDEQRLYLLFNKKDGVLDLIKNNEAYNKLRKFDDEEEGLKPIPFLLAKTVRIVNELEVADDNTRNLMNEHLLSKAKAASKTRELELSTSSINQNTKKPEPVRRRFSSVSILLLLIFFTALGVGSFYFQSKKPNDAPLNQGALQDSSIQTDTSLVLASEKKSAKKNVSAKKKNRKKEKKTAKAEEKEPLAKTIVQYKTVNAEKEIEENRSNTDTKGLYNVISKAYFHNEPDEATRRNAFVVHWNNSYAKLKALDEKNGFIYVVFNNHLNQTSKGWLRKKDLKPIDE